MTINVALAGAGAFGIKHLDAIKAIDGVKVVSLVGRERPKTEDVARKYGIAHATTDLTDVPTLRAELAGDDGRQRLRAADTFNSLSPFYFRMGRGSG